MSKKGISLHLGLNRVDPAHYVAGSANAAFEAQKPFTI
jgi:hypothetical protein